jgi:hypothetical protein
MAATAIEIQRDRSAPANEWSASLAIGFAVLAVLSALAGAVAPFFAYVAFDRAGLDISNVAYALVLAVLVLTSLLISLQGLTGGRRLRGALPNGAPFIFNRRAVVLAGTTAQPQPSGPMWAERLQAETRWLEGESSGRALQESRLELFNLYVWRPAYVWLVLQPFPLIAFWFWSRGDPVRTGWLIPGIVLAAVYLLHCAPIETVFAYRFADRNARKRLGWFLGDTIWSIAFANGWRNTISRVAQLRLIFGRRSRPTQQSAADEPQQPATAATPAPLPKDSEDRQEEPQIEDAKGLGSSEADLESTGRDLQRRSAAASPANTDELTTGVTPSEESEPAIEISGDHIESTESPADELDESSEPSDEHAKVPATGVGADQPTPAPVWPHASFPGSAPEGGVGADQRTPAPVWPHVSFPGSAPEGGVGADQRTPAPVWPHASFPGSAPEGSAGADQRTPAPVDGGDESAGDVLASEPEKLDETAPPPAELNQTMPAEEVVAHAEAHRQAIEAAEQLTSQVEALAVQLAERAQECARLASRIDELELSLDAGESARKELQETPAAQISAGELTALRQTMDALLADSSNLIALAAVSRQSQQLSEIVEAYARIRKQSD